MATPSGAVVHRDEVAAIDALDSGIRGGPDPDLITTELYPLKIEN